MLSINLLGLKLFLEKVNRLQKALNETEILDESAALLLNRIRTRFLAEQDPDGNQWKPSQRALATGGRTLFKTGTLFHSLQAYAVGQDDRAIGTDVLYAPFHQFGTPNMVARPFLGFNEDDLSIVEKRIIQRVEEALE